LAVHAAFEAPVLDLQVPVATQLILELVLAHVLVSFVQSAHQRGTYSDGAHEPRLFLSDLFAAVLAVRLTGKYTAIPINNTPIRRSHSVHGAMLRAHFLKEASS